MRLLASVAIVCVLVLPGVLPESGQADLAQAEWTEGPVDDGIPRADEGHHFRVLIEVAAEPGQAGQRNLPVTMTLDIAEHMAAAGFPVRSNGQLDGFALDPESLVLVEVDPATHGPVEKRGGEAVHVPLMVFQGGFDGIAPFHPEVNPTVTLQWVVDGVLDEDRMYMLYFDATFNGDKDPETFPPEALGRIAAAVGPGRGTEFYVMLHDRIKNLPKEPRVLRMTNTEDRPVLVDLYEYSRFGVPHPNPAFSGIEVPAGPGVTLEKSWRTDYEGRALLVRADGPILVEATSSNVLTDFGHGTAGIFVPTRDGGYVGQRFAQTPAADGAWIVFCPSQVEDPERRCTGSLDQAGSSTPLDIAPDTFDRIEVAGGAPATLEMQQGDVAVTRTAEADPSTRPPTLWPAMDGPAVGSRFMGHALNSEIFMLTSRHEGAEIFVKDLAGSRQTLSDALEVGRGLFEEPNVAEFGTTWDRDWRLRSDPSARPLHSDGPVRLREVTGAGGIQLLNGLVPSSAKASGVVALQSPDGGLTYRVTIPETDAGSPFGRIVVFAPHGGTSLALSSRGLDGGTGSGQSLAWNGLSQGRVIDDELVGLGPGVWTVEADRPVLVYWIRHGDEAMSGFAAGITQATQTRVVAAQYAGFLVGLDPVTRSQTAAAGDRVEFEVSVRNLARTVDGEGRADQVRLVAHAPPGWDLPEVVPATLDLGPGGSERVRVRAVVPDGFSLEDGLANLQLRAHSTGEPRMQATAQLSIQFEVVRDVRVIVDGEPGSVTRSVVPGESATFEVVVENAGSVADRFRIEHSLGDGDWQQELVLCQLGPPDSVAPFPCPEGGSGTTPEMEPGAGASFLFTVEPRPDGNPFRHTTRLLATSLGDPSVAEGVQFRTTIETDRSFVVQVNESTRTITPGASTTYDITITNEADVDEELDVELLSSLPTEAWLEPEVRVFLEGLDRATGLDALNGTIPIPARGQARVELDQHVPDDAPPFQMALSRMAFESRLGSTSTELSLRTISARTAGVDAIVESALLSAAPGSVLTIPMTVVSTANADQQLTVHVEGLGDEWDVLSGGLPGPWSTAVPNGSRIDMQIEIHVPRSAQPAGEGSIPFSIRLRAPGMPAHQVPLELRVGEALDATVDVDPVTLKPGRTNTLALEVANTGNLPLRACTFLAGAPEGWIHGGTRVSLERGRVATLDHAVRLPPGQASGSHEVMVELRLTETAGCRPDGLLVASVPVAATVRDVELTASVLEVHALGGGQASYLVSLRNLGSESAHNVTLSLLERDTLRDATRLHQVRAGSEQTVALVGPAGRATSIQVEADHLAQPVVLDSMSDPSSDRNAPSVAVPLILVAVCLVRRWRW